jgi:hypothetical protein
MALPHRGAGRSRGRRHPRSHPVHGTRLPAAPGECRLTSMSHIGCWDNVVIRASRHHNEGTARRQRVRDTSRGEPCGVRVHRALVQPPASLLTLGYHTPGRVQSGGVEGRLTAVSTKSRKVKVAKFYRNSVTTESYLRHDSAGVVAHRANSNTSHC